MTIVSAPLFRIAAFRHLLFTRFFTALALQSQAVIVGWQVYSLTKSPFLLGLTGLVEAVPAILAAFYAGYVVDQVHPRRVYIGCLGVLALNAIALLAQAGGFFQLDDRHVLYALFAGVFFSGVARSFVMPAAFSMTPMIVPRRDIPAALPWFHGGFQVASMGGPALAGLVYGGYGPQVAWFIPALCAFFAFLLACSIRGLPPREKPAKREKFLKSLRSGWSFIMDNRLLLSIMVLDMFAVLFGGAVAMLPAFADEVLALGSEGLGLLRASPAVGALAVSVLLALFPLRRPSGRVLLAAVTGFGLSMIGFGMSGSFAAAAFFLALSGVFDSVSVLVRGAMMQFLTPDHMRGRVSSVGSMFIISSNEIGAFESGTAARLMGLVSSILFGGIVTLVVAAVTAVAVPGLRRAVVHADSGQKS